MPLLTAREVAELLDRHGLTPSRALGQNFVVDPNTIDRIVRLSGVTAGDRVVEIGAGCGSLTRGLAQEGAEVLAIELDRHLLPVLSEVLDGLDVEVVHTDAMTLEWAERLAPGSSWKLVANLPYNVATPLVLDVLDGVPEVTEMTVMVQSEVADRLAAGPGDAAYGIPSVKVAYWAEAKLLGRVPASVFLPRPRVESALVRIVRRDQPAVEADPDLLFDLVRTAFGQRRKMLRRSLSGLADASAFEAAAVASDVRPEELSVQEWGRLATAVGATR
jgi:16S rRNA (adenine1518-N6/adenine1519-N6)-dimethyltransferase